MFQFWLLLSQFLSISFVYPLCIFPCISFSLHLSQQLFLHFHSSFISALLFFFLWHFPACCCLPVFRSLWWAKTNSAKKINPDHQLVYSTEAQELNCILFQLGLWRCGKIAPSQNACVSVCVWGPNLEAQEQCRVHPYPRYTSTSVHQGHTLIWAEGGIFQHWGKTSIWDFVHQH